MKSSYKRLGPYIRPVDIRNVEDKQVHLLGVSTQKIFIESIANTIGTDFKKYKVVKKRQFTYVPDTSRRGDRIGIALLETHEEALVSPVYTVFEIIDTEELLPEYLMMWFRRPEFDRYARYMSHGSVREPFGWEEMCDIELPIPGIEKQYEIVKEYHTIIDRIALNEQFNQKLEETAQTVYKQWFVDFEFPISAEYAASIGKPELAGKPYKSNGGQLIYREIFDADIPLLWAVGAISDLGSVVGGATPSRDVPEFWTENGIAWISPRDLSKRGNKFIARGESYISELGYSKCSAKLIPESSVLFSSRAPIGYLAISLNPVCTNQGFKSVIPKKRFGTAFVYYYLRFSTEDIKNQATGSTFDEISGSMMNNYRAFLPTIEVCTEFASICASIFKVQRNLEGENQALEDLLELMLGKMSVIKL